MQGQGASVSNVQDSLISELERAMHSGHDKCVETLRRVTDLFLVNADRFNESQIGLFDDVLLLLMQRIETKARVELSTRLALADKAPIKVVQHLARDDEITVAKPVLTGSPRLSASDLIEIAQTKSQEHLLAISGRRQIEEAVTDALLDRGNRDVARKLAQNLGARFSEPGFAALATKAETDESIAEALGPRPDIPPQLLRKLVSRATKAVQTKLLAVAPPAAEREIRSVLATIAKEVSWEATTAHDFRQAQEFVLAMHVQGQLDEAALLDFARLHKYRQMVAALSLLCSAPVELIDNLMRSPRHDGVLVPCKAARLSWATANTILRNRFSHHSLSGQDRDQLKLDYSRLSEATAQRLLGFWQARMTTQAGRPD